MRIVGVGSSLRGVLSAVLTALLGLTLLGLPAPEAAAAPGQADATVWEPVWSDEFDDVAGTAPDPGTWTHETGNDKGYNDGNHELQYYTPGAENAQTDGDGHLVITAREAGAEAYPCRYTRSDSPTQGGPGACDYTSARITTENAVFAQPRYGRMEARIKLPGGVGLLPAFWALGTGSAGWPDGGEMDVLESTATAECLVCSGLVGPNRAFPPSSGQNHFDRKWGKGSGNTFTKLTNQQLSGDFHVYAADWYPDRVEYSVDGMPVFTQRKADTPQGSWVFDKPFYMVLNLAVGGGWVKDPPAATAFPQRMSVDYVRLYKQKRPLQDTTGTVRSAYAGDRCMDVLGDTDADGTPVQLMNCDAGAAQRWVMKTDGTVRSGLASGRCLDVKSSGLSDGTPVQLYGCNGSAAQQWVADAQGQLRNPNSGKCLHIAKAGVEEGSRLEIYECVTSPAQVWALPVTAEWPLHDRPARTAVDASGGGRDVSCTTGLSWTDDATRGVVGQFDGDTGACTTDGIVLRTSESFTVSAWAKLDAAGLTRNATVVSQDGNRISGFYLQYDGSDQRWAFKKTDTDSDTSGLTQAARSSAVATAAWTHLTGVYDAGADTISLYVNGVLQSAPVAVPNDSWDAEGAFTIGRGKWAGQDVDHFPGRVSSVRARSHALSAAAVRSVNSEDVARVALPLP
ncbi:ricin-type beta-trefoil lectin domain protein [Streptomyces phaeochromogenes]